MSLLELIKKNKDMRRIFGRSELKIIEKQLMGINLSASEITRLSRDIRPKFKIIKEISNFREELDLKKAQEIKYLISQAKEIILESDLRMKMKKVYIFGSFVEKKLREDSDIDIAVEFYDISKKDATQFRIDISSKVNEKIDIQVFNILPEKIKKEILEKGKVIYEQDK